MSMSGHVIVKLPARTQVLHFCQEQKSEAFILNIATLSQPFERDLPFVLNIKKPAIKLNADQLRNI